MILVVRENANFNEEIQFKPANKSKRRKPKNKRR